MKVFPTKVLQMSEVIGNQFSPDSHVENFVLLEVLVGEPSKLKAASFIIC